MLNLNFDGLLLPPTDAGYAAARSNDSAPVTSTTRGDFDQHLKRASDSREPDQAADRPDSRPPGRSSSAETPARDAPNSDRSTSEESAKDTLSPDRTPDHRSESSSSRRASSPAPGREPTEHFKAAGTRDQQGAKATTVTPASEVALVEGVEHAEAIGAKRTGPKSATKTGRPHSRTTSNRGAGKEALSAEHETKKTAEANGEKAVHETGKRVEAEVLPVTFVRPTDKANEKAVAEIAIPAPVDTANLGASPVPPIALEDSPIAAKTVEASARTSASAEISPSKGRPELDSRDLGLKTTGKAPVVHGDAAPTEPLPADANGDSRSATRVGEAPSRKTRETDVLPTAGGAGSLAKSLAREVDLFAPPSATPAIESLSSEVLSSADQGPVTRGADSTPAAQAPAASSRPEPTTPNTTAASMVNPSVSSRPTWDHAVGQSRPNSAGLTEIERVRFIQRVARAFQLAPERGGTLKLRLSPPELGSLQLEIQVREGVLSARVGAETPAAKSLLLDSLPQLRERLAQQEIRVDRFEVDIRDPRGGGQQADFGGAQGREPTPRREPNGRRAEPSAMESNLAAPIPRSAAAAGRLNVIV